MRSERALGLHGVLQAADYDYPEQLNKFSIP